MGATRSYAPERARGVGKHRFKAAALVVALAGGLLALAAPAASAATTQNGPVNYVGPGPCPAGAEAEDCLITSGDVDVIQTAPTGGSSTIDCRGASCKGTQSGSDAAAKPQNTAACANSTAAATSDQRCEISQAGGNNSIITDLSASPSTGGVLNLANVLQQNEQRFITSQNGDTNSLVVKGNISQSATSSLDASTPVTHTQRTLQLANNTLNATTNNTVEYAFTRTQNSSATGATPTQLLDNVAGSESDGAKLGLGRIDLVANSAGTSNIKVRGADNKTVNATSLNFGTATQQLGHPDGGWTASLDIDTAVPNADGSPDLDIGDPNGAPGLSKTWSAHAQGPFGANVARDQDLIDDIKIPLLGRSPVNGQAHGANKLTSDPNAHLDCGGESSGHVQNLLHGKLSCDLTAGGEAQNPAVTWNAQDWDVSVACKVNVDECPGGTVGGPTAVSIKIFGEDKKAGAIPVAILTTPDFDALTVDPATVCFGDAEAPIERDCTVSNRGTGAEDVDGDGDADLKMHFDSKETGIDKTDKTACLTGETYEGEKVAGCGNLPKG